MKRKKINKPLNDKIKFIPCNEKVLIYSYSRGDRKSVRFETAYRR